MDFHHYQQEASKTDQVAGLEEQNIVVPLLGLAGEAGSLLTEYKKHFRDGDAYRIFKERIAEELGDVLWYMANIATKAGLSLDEVAQGNLRKINDRWRASENGDGSQRLGSKLFDERYPPQEQFPRHFEVNVQQVTEGEAVKVILTMNGEQMGDRLTDNTYDDDGYRFHDVFHMTYAAILGWSPVTRKLMKRKRKSAPKVEEIEDGGRAIVIEEAISAIVFGYAKDCSFFDGVDTMDYSLLCTIKNLTSHLEVNRCSTGEWERAILEGYRVWRQIRQRGKGTIVGDLYMHAIDLQAI
jgi:NTP pyrophosphatase (non-canonical NTP hydrolase)